MNRPTHIPGKPFIGKTKDILADPILFSAKLALENLPLVSVKLPGRTLYVTADADIVAEILVKEADKFSRGANYKRLALVGGNGLITSEGEFWKRQRRLAQPGFHKERINGFLKTFIQLAEDMDARWDKMKGQNIVMSDEMSRFTLKAVGITLFSNDIEAEHPDFPQYIRALLRFINLRHYQMIRFPIHWPTPSNKRFRKQLDYLNSIIYNQIDRRESSGKEYHDLLDMFLSQIDEETGEQMSREHIRNEFFTMVAAGYETSSVALTWTWYMLNQEPKYAAKVYEEMDRVIGSGPVLPEHLPQLVYTKMFVQETMRVYPPVFAIPRSIKDDMELGGFQLKGKQPILITLYGLNRNPAYWNNPEEFNPENFSEEAKQKRHKHAYLPFGSGQRMCIGSEFAMYEIMALLAVLARKYRPKPRPGYVPKMLASIATNVTEGMPMILETE
ncbi:MAG: cytochrome P450 [Bacteroidetes bacterium]|nr:MAG: cytochrome P450 [Bacteroidota bacterium]